MKTPDLFADPLDIMRHEIVTCTKCPLSLTRTHAVPGDGSRNARLMFIGEAPGAAEDQAGMPFVGRSGKLLSEVLGRHGIRREDVFITNIVKCRPPENRDPRPMEIQACSPYLAGQIELINPKYICVLGRLAAARLLGRPVKITVEHGQWLEYHSRQLLIALHPSAALRTPAFRQQFEYDIEVLAKAYFESAT